MSTRPTIRDVAKHAGVGFKTVSRVINDEKSVSAEMRARVEASIRALEYRPNAAARVLRKQVSRSIGFVCEDIAEPVQSQLAKAIETVASENGSLLTVSVTHHDPDRERAVIESLVERQVDGLVLVATGPNLRYLRRLARGVPIVCIDRLPTGFDTDTVLADNAPGATDAVAHLIERGHRRIAFTGDAGDLFTQRERLNGYRQALAGAGIDLDPTLVYQAPPDVDRLRKQVSYWRSFREAPTAIFSASSLTTMDLLHAIPPEQTVALVGFDDFPLADIARGGLTVVSQDVQTMGRLGAQTLFRRLAGEDGVFTRTRVATSLVIRRSTTS
jgi:LacI family transcriptional regulator